MNLYFSCSLTGGRADQPVYAAIVDFLQALGHRVPTAHLAHPEIMAEEAVIEPQVVYRRDVQWLDQAQAVIAEVSTPSHGVGYEIAWALRAGKPVLCLYRHGARVSKMITGNSEPRLRLAAYRDQAEALEAIGHFVKGLGEI